jgi:hypothetical protein
MLIIWSFAIKVLLQYFKKISYSIYKDTFIFKHKYMHSYEFDFKNAFLKL